VDAGPGPPAGSVIARESDDPEVGTAEGYAPVRLQ
jgi:hypothetical protein